MEELSDESKMLNLIDEIRPFRTTMTKAPLNAGIEIRKVPAYQEWTAFQKKRPSFPHASKPCQRRGGGDFSHRGLLFV
jgi:hypothetical protein